VASGWETGDISGEPDDDRCTDGSDPDDVTQGRSSCGDSTSIRFFDAFNIVSSLAMSSTSSFPMRTRCRATSLSILALVSS